MSAPTVAPALTDPEQLRTLLDPSRPLTDEQLDAATAPLEPGLVVAGAGAGKTTVMAARVVWLVGSGQVAPSQVLGLTFTNKAAAELAARVRWALTRLDVAAGQHAAIDSETDSEDDADAGADAEPTVATYHAFAGRLVREHGLRIGVEPDARLLADATRYQLAHKVLRRASGPFDHLQRAVVTLIDDVISLDAELSEHLVTPAQLRAHERAAIADIETNGECDKNGRRYRDLDKLLGVLRARVELTGLVEEYRAAKRALDAIDFGDQIAFAARLAEESAEVGEQVRAAYRVVLLDEYQDTSVAQRRMLAGLFGPAAPGGSATAAGFPVTAVGDPCQAIYGWRGASVANLDNFPEHFPHVGGAPATIYPLTMNQRSGGLLLRLANAVSAALRAIHRGVRELRPRPAAATTGDTVCGLFATQTDEVTWLADQVAAQVDGGRSPGDVAVLVRTHAEIPALHAALVERGVPVEVVGLGGLLALPEVGDLVATLSVIADPTANAELVRLLSGPRWAIGQRDLVLLGRRAAHLVRSYTDDPADEADGGTQAPSAETVERDPLLEAVAGIDPSEVVSLSDALERPGTLPYSPQARERFAALAAELRELRRHAADPLVDLLHAVLRVSGLDIELAASPSALAARRRESVAAFLEHAAAFVDLADVDTGAPSLPAFLAFLKAAQRYDRGLDANGPSGGDAVQMLTVHKAKGLEWDVVVVPSLCDAAFPSSRSRDRWTGSPKVLPYPLRGDADGLPSVPDWTREGLKAFADGCREESGREERRLGYVAFTRARECLIASGHWWGPTQIKPRGPSEFLTELRAHCDAGHGTIAQWADKPADGATNPLLAVVRELAWPAPLDPVALAMRRDVAAAVRDAMARIGAGQAVDVINAGESPTVSEAALVAAWDADATTLLAEARAARERSRDVELPASLSASQMLRLAADPQGLARDLARPMPRKPVAAARRGTRFHAWVENRFGQRPLIEPEDVPGAADVAREADEVDEARMAALREAFLASEYADRPPLRVEEPFQLLLGDTVVRGRIDAVYENPAPGAGPHYEVVDWKTGGSLARPSDPLQLAIYRVAWAGIANVPLDQVGAAFLYVATGEVQRLRDLPDTAGLARLLRV